MLDDSRCVSVDSGTIAVSSRLLEESDPADASTPRTVKAMVSMVTDCPTGLSLPNSSSAVVGCRRRAATSATGRLATE